MHKFSIIRSSFLRALDVLFADGWFFLVPGTLVFLFGWLFNAPIPLARSAMQGVHALTAILALFFLTTKTRHWNRSDILFWGLLLLALLLPGAYLEYPSDPWEHVRRLFNWGSPLVTRMRETDRDAAHASYFIAWSALGPLGLEWRRPGLDAYSAFTQFLLAVQVFRIAITLGCSRTIARMQVIGFFVLFGTNLFSFRYYALAATAIAYVAYLGYLRTLLVGTLQRTWSEAWKIPFAFLVMGTNHLQEVLLAALAAGVFATWWSIRDRAKDPARALALALVAWLVVNVIVGTLLMRYYPQLYYQRGFDETKAYSFFGTYRLWRPFNSVGQTVGIFGTVALCVAVWRFRVAPILAMLTLAPVVLLQSVPFVLWTIRNFNHEYIVYRIFFLIPPSLLVLRVLEEGWSRLKLRYRGATVVFLLLCCSLPRYPWRGKAWFQLYRPSTDRALVPQDETARWLRDHRSWPPGCRLITDEMTEYALGVQLHLAHSRDRTAPDRRLQATRLWDVRQAFATSPRHCGVLLADPKLVPVWSDSRIARRSQHWSSEVGDLHWYLNAALFDDVASLEKEGWKKTFVPPYYQLFEPRN